MSQFIFLSLFVPFIFSSQQTLASTSSTFQGEGKCEERVIEIAKKLDLIYSEANGPFQGDFDTEELPVTSKLILETQIKSELSDYQDIEQQFSVQIEHMNEDSEQWSNIYKVKILKTIYKKKDVYCSSVISFSMDRSITN